MTMTPNHTGSKPSDLTSGSTTGMVRMRMATWSITQPSNKKMVRMKNITTQGETCKAPTHATMFCVACVRVKK